MPMKKLKQKTTTSLLVLKIITLLGLIIHFTFIAGQTTSKSQTLTSKSVILKKKVKKSRVQYVGRYRLKDLQNYYTSWGINPLEKKANINLRKAWTIFQKKRDVVVAVVDTGIDPKHPFLKNNLIVRKGKLSKTNYGGDFSVSKVSFTGTPIDTHGHGTHVAGIVKSIFPEVKILALKYYNPRGSGQDNLTATIRALRYAVNVGVDIINYSGGGPEPAAAELNVLKEAERKGILVVAASGNEHSNIDIPKNRYYPASYNLNNIISVTAHNQSLQVLASSNYGKKSVDIAAPGYRIRSAIPGTRASQIGTAGYMTGTSQATAFVTGVAALIKSQFPHLATPTIRKIINKSANRGSAIIQAKTKSQGRLDAYKALLTAAQYANLRFARPGVPSRTKKTIHQKVKKTKKVPASRK